MQILTRSRRVRKALSAVQARIPPSEWQTITSFLTRIRADVEWQTLGLSGIEPSSAALLPLYGSDFRTIIGAQARFILPLCSLFSDKALIGVVAHEFAHATRAAKLGKNWLSKMDGERVNANKSEERRADAIASKWGFAEEIRAMRNERQTVLNPYLAVHNERILRQVERRNRIADEKVRNKFKHEKAETR